LRRLAEIHKSRFAMLSRALRGVASSSVRGWQSRCPAVATRSKASVTNIFAPTEEHAALRDLVRSFTAAEVEPQALEFNKHEKLNLPLLRKLGELGLLGVCTDEKFGGAGMDALAVCIAHEELSYSDPAFCLAYLAHSLLFVHNVDINASEALKEAKLAPYVSGEKIGGMGMSEPGAGTDVLGLTSSAKPHGDDAWVLNGNKMWITNGCISATELGDGFLIYARSGDNRQDLTMFLVEKGMPGFSLGQQIKDKCGMRASTTAELVFDNVVVPKANIIGDVHKGIIPMMRNLEIERVALAAMSLGIARRSIDAMRKYATERKAFGQPIVKYGQIQRHIADSYAEYSAGRAYVYNLAANLSLESSGNRIDSDGVKLFCTTMGKNCADRAMQVHGGYGYVGEYVVERLWRDSKLLEIGGGTLEAHQKNMALDLTRLDSLPN